MPGSPRRTSWSSPPPRTPTLPPSSTRPSTTTSCGGPGRSCFPPRRSRAACGGSSANTASRPSGLAQRPRSLCWRPAPAPPGRRGWWPPLTATRLAGPCSPAPEVCSVILAATWTRSPSSLVMCVAVLPECSAPMRRGNPCPVASMPRVLPPTRRLVSACADASASRIRGSSSRSAGWFPGKGRTPSWQRCRRSCDRFRTPTS